MIVLYYGHILIRLIYDLCPRILTNISQFCFTSFLFFIVHNYISPKVDDVV